MIIEHCNNTYDIVQKNDATWLETEEASAEYEHNPEDWNQEEG